MKTNEQCIDVELARLLLWQTVSEAEFQQQVIQIARLLGWLTYHVYDSRKSSPGFPDLVLCRVDGTGFMMPELKSEKGRVRSEQQLWLNALRANGIECPVWRPSQIDHIIERLRK